VAVPDVHDAEDRDRQAGEARMALNLAVVLAATANMVLALS
jgi:hypothetical protein